MSQRNWGEFRADRPSVLFKVCRVLKEDHSHKPGYWFHRGRVILDTTLHVPLRDYAELPSTISSVAEGWLIEAWCRVNPVISLDNDIIPRMILYNDKRSQRVSSMQARREEFRTRTGCLPWVKRGEYRRLEQVFWSIVPSSVRLANSTQGWRDFTPEESRLLRTKTFARDIVTGPAAQQVTLQSSCQSSSDPASSQAPTIAPVAQSKRPYNDASLTATLTGSPGDYHVQGYAQATTLYPSQAAQTTFASTSYGYGYAGPALAQTRGCGYMYGTTATNHVPHGQTVASSYHQKRQRLRLRSGQEDRQAKRRVQSHGDQGVSENKNNRVLEWIQDCCGNEVSGEENDRNVLQEGHDSSNPDTAFVDAFIDPALRWI
jgi:hypothetical protein